MCCSLNDGADGKPQDLRKLLWSRSVWLGNKH